MKHIKSFNESNLDDFVDISKQFLPNKSAHITVTDIISGIKEQI